MIAPPVALVYPPFGPARLPSLGLALLSARLKQQGYAARTFYWNLDMIAAMPGATLQDRIQAYQILTERTWHPYNEWIFESVVHGTSTTPSLAATEFMLLQHGMSAATRWIDPLDMLHLREAAQGLVEEFAATLDPYPWVGISTTFFQNMPALALARVLKRRDPSKVVIFGGANVDGPMGPALLKLYPFIDYVMSGEVDMGFVALLDALRDGRPVGAIAGLHRRDAEAPDAIRSTPSEPPRAGGMADLPLPDYDDFVATRRRLGLDVATELVLTLESSRGCWWGEKSHCTFCGLNASGMAFRSKAADRLKGEILAVKERYDPKFVFMTDNIMAHGYYDDLLAWLEDNALDIHFFYEIKSNATRQQVKRLADAGVSAVQPGIESFSTPILRLMRKGVSGAQNVAFLKYARDYGILTAYNILVGFPGEDTGDYDAFVAQMPRLIHLRPPASLPLVEFHRFSPYHDHPDDYGLKLTPHEAYKVLYPFDEPMLAEIAYSFVRAGGPGAVPSMPYLDGLRSGVLAWKAADGMKHPFLTHEEAGEAILIRDGRPAFGPANYRVGGAAAKVFRLLDQPRSVPGLLRLMTDVSGEDDRIDAPTFLAETLASGALPIIFDTPTFKQDPDGCLALFDGPGLIYKDRDDMGRTAYVSLPTSAGAPRESRAWSDVGI